MKGHKFTFTLLEKLRTMAAESSKSNLHHFKAHVLSDIGKQ